MSKFDSSSYNRKSASSDVDSNKKKNRLNIIESEVKKLFNNGQDITVQDMEQLRQKYVDTNLVDDIYDAFYAKLRKVTKRAKKFAKVILRKYHHLPLHKALQKALKYKKHYNLSDSIFSEFKRIYEQELVGYQNKLSHFQHKYERTRIGKTLGDNAAISVGKLKYKDNELVVLQEILRLHAETKVLHSQVMIQSLTYRDCAKEALLGKAISGGVIKVNPANYVHPIVAALFLPKIKIIEEHFLFANIANIIKSKHEGKPIITMPEYELYYDLVTDPNDIVCDIDSPLSDLKNRCILQKELWNAVINLRNGRYYQSSLASFLASVDNCRINMYDTPDLIYIRDEGAILRRILSAFSFRPTVVSTMPISNLAVVQNNPYARPQVLSNVTAIPMVTLRLPLQTMSSMSAVNLDDSLNQSHFYLENNSIIPKNQAIIYSRGVLFFYVNRRYQSVNISKFIHPRPIFRTLPMTVSGFEKLNTKVVNFNLSMNIMNDNYKLRSVIVVETSKLQDASKDLILGTSAMVVKNRQLPDILNDEFYHYDPISATQIEPDGSYDDPITTLDYVRTQANINNPVETFNERARKRGTIFIYEKEDSSSNNPFWN